MGSLLGESHRPAGNGVPPGDSAGFMLMGISAICIVELTIIPSRFPCYLHAKWSFTETGKHSTKCHSYLALQERQGSGAYAESSWQGNGKGSYEKSWAVSAFHSGRLLPPAAAADSRIYLPLQIISKIFNQGIGGSFDSHLYSRLVDPHNRSPTSNPTSGCFRL